jgi:hypothetical protein
MPGGGHWSSTSRYPEPGGAVTVAPLPVERADEARRELAGRVLRAAEAPRLVKPRPEPIARALAAAFAEQVVAPDSLTVDEVLEWVDGPGLDVILSVCRDGGPPSPTAPGRPRVGRKGARVKSPFGR